jgi:hypothetical protein
MESSEIEKKWKILFSDLEKKFGGDLSLDAIIFMIGVDVLGKGFQKLSKDQKLDVMHISVCHLLTPYGFYNFEGRDKDGWPHWSRAEKLPPLNGNQQETLMKEAILQYFEKDFAII